MAKLTNVQKAERTLKLLLGMRIPRVAQQLTPHGFRRETLEDGWARLRAVGMGTSEHPTALAPARAEPPAVLDRAEERPVPELDAFENLWFPIARASLREPYPRIAELLFANVSQTRGPQSVIGVLHFLDRLGAMERGEAPFGADGPAARQLLAERGLTRERERAGRALLDRLREIESASVFPVLSAEEEAVNVEAMWAWYLEWSVIARTAIKNQTLLKLLGFSPRARAQPPRAAEQALESVTVSVRESRDRPAGSRSPRSEPRARLLGPSQRRTKRVKR